MLFIYNSLTKKKELFEPIDAGKVRMYVCGMTVYDYCHLGHGRALIVFDMIYRFLQEIGFDVTYVRNITDIDDKIIKRANENGEPFEELTARFIEAMQEDADALLVKRPDIEPKATENIETILNMIETLIHKGYAYQAANGDVYYSVAAFEGYGKLSGRSDRNSQLAGARVDIGEDKHDPLDFVLWKMAKPGEPSWDSPWGQGRPGWHIECSAMSTRYLGTYFDIHGGGQDLQFPHHENEIAQSEACTGHSYVKYWLHNGFVRVNEEKMSKSLGNFFTLREVLKKYKAEEIRFFILNSHYRSPVNYSDEQLNSARASLTRLYTSMRDMPVVEIGDYGVEFKNSFYKAMNDDFNTPEALAVLFEIAHEVHRLSNTDAQTAAQAVALLRKLGGILGLLGADSNAYLQSLPAQGGIGEEAINDLIAQRTQARAEKNWQESDRIRDLLVEQGVALEDTAQGTQWRRT